MMKRIIATLVLVLSSGVLAAPLVASANCAPEVAPVIHAGDSVKLANRSTIFFIADNGMRYNFPTASVYKTWYGNDFSQVKTVSPSQLAMHQMGGYVSFRPNTRLVKFTTSPDVYAVGKNGELRRLATPAVARALFGANWNRMIETLPSNMKAAFASSFDISTPSDFQVVSQSEPIVITSIPKMNMTVMR